MLLVCSSLFLTFLDGLSVNTVFESCSLRPVEMGEDREWPREKAWPLFLLLDRPLGSILSLLLVIPPAWTCVFWACWCCCRALGQEKFQLGSPLTVVSLPFLPVPILASRKYHRSSSPLGFGAPVSSFHRISVVYLFYPV